MDCTLPQVRSIWLFLNFFQLRRQQWREDRFQDQIEAGVSEAMQQIEGDPCGVIRPKTGDTHHFHGEQGNDEAVEQPAEEGEEREQDSPVPFLAWAVEWLHDKSGNENQHAETGDLSDRPRTHSQQEVGQNNRQDGNDEAVRHAQCQRQDDQHGCHRLDVRDELEHQPADIAQGRQDRQQRQPPHPEADSFPYISVRFHTITSPSWSATSAAPTIEGSPFTSNSQYLAFVSAVSSTCACPSMAVMKPSASSMV